MMRASVTFSTGSILFSRDILFSHDPLLQPNILISCAACIFAYPWSLHVICFLHSALAIQNLFKIFFNVYFWERERQSASRGGAEREGETVWSKLQALSCQHRAQHGAWTHKLWDHELSGSQEPNRLSHPGAPLTVQNLIQPPFPSLNPTTSVKPIWST